MLDKLQSGVISSLAHLAAKLQASEACLHGNGAEGPVQGKRVARRRWKKTAFFLNRYSWEEGEALQGGGFGHREDPELVERVPEVVQGGRELGSLVGLLGNHPSVNMS